MTVQDEFATMCRIATAQKRSASWAYAMMMLKIAVQLDAGTRVVDLAKGEQA